MKNILSIITIMIITSFTSNHLQAQWGIGTGLAFGSETKNYDAGIGIQIKGIYVLDDQWRIAADFINYLDRDDDFSIREFNINGHYIFHNRGAIVAYGLGGINIISAKITVEGRKESGSETGLNLGAGAQYYFNDYFSALAELKLSLSDFDQTVLAIGIVYGF